jgi:hypothetical protein
LSGVNVSTNANDDAGGTADMKNISTDAQGTFILFFQTFKQIFQTS